MKSYSTLNPQVGLCADNPEARLHCLTTAMCGRCLECSQALPKAVWGSHQLKSLVNLEKCTRRPTLEISFGPRSRYGRYAGISNFGFLGDDLRQQKHQLFKRGKDRRGCTQGDRRSEAAHGAAKHDTVDVYVLSNARSRKQEGTTVLTETS